MKLTIDNLDGLGAVDYSGAIERSLGTKPVTLERVLNAPSKLACTLCLTDSTLATPVRRARVTMAADAGTTLFTGYLTTEPVAVYAGVDSRGPVYRLALRAVSDEWLLDKQSAGTAFGPAVAQTGGKILKSLTSRLGSNAFVTSGVTNGRSVGVFIPEPDASWSAHAGAVADSTLSSYRALGGALTLSSIPGSVHTLSDGDGTLDLAGFNPATLRELANDATVTGEMGAAAYWTELFTGDGTTAAFALTGEPEAMAEGKATLLADAFNQAAFNPQTWSIADPGSHLALGAAGLMLSGGNGFDGQTTLTANDALELGGTLTIELGNVQLGPASAGVLGGLYSGATAQANCIAGFSIRQAGGQTLAVPLVSGVEAGTDFPLLSGHAYTLRLRLHCPERQRALQAFYAIDNGAVAEFGGGLVDAPLALVFEVRDLGQSSNTPATVLFDGVLTSSPAQAILVAANSVQLFGSVGSVRVERTGTAWVRTTDPATGTPSTRLIGEAGEGLDAKTSATVTGTVTFFAGRTPAADELVTVLYRGRRRAVARLADAASIATEQAGGGVGTARWLGRVVRPAARSSADCENAALAVLSFAANRAAAAAGTYVAVNPVGGDILPGDLLALTTGATTMNAIVRRVTIEEAGAAPETLTYRIAFANDWAEGLGLKLSEASARDALLPAAALDIVPAPGGGTASVPVHVLANLLSLAVVGINASAIQVDAGLAPPAGGGFEVRRRDAGFGTGLTGASAGAADLVLRSPVRGFSIPRAAFEERFFIRMYDASTPPLYSRESSALVTHVAVS